jgi:hypothetical protein
MPDRNKPTPVQQWSVHVATVAAWHHMAAFAARMVEAVENPSVSNVRKPENHMRLLSLDHSMYDCQEMPTLSIPNEASIRTLRNFLSGNTPFSDTVDPAQLVMHPRWTFMDPLAMAMTAAWGGWCQRNACSIKAENIAGPHTKYAVRMGLFKHLRVPHDPLTEEHEEAGRFIPLSQVKTGRELAGVIGNVSALLHLDNEPNALAAVQYCVSELIRNVLEHSASPEGAFVCAQRYSTQSQQRVSIAVADCGFGIAEHLSHAYPEAKDDSQVALRLAMQFGVTGAVRSGMYGGATDNAGAGLFFTRAIAKATGGYFVLLSGDGVFRARRPLKKKKTTIYADAFNDPRHDFWNLDWSWPGTVAAVEIFTQNVGHFPKFFQSIRQQLPATRTAKGRIKFT